MGFFSFFQKKRLASSKDSPSEDLERMKDRFSQVLTELSSTARPLTRITVQEASVSLTDSKFGGLAYLPIGGKPPQGADGTELFLLAQFNLSQLPAGSFPISQGMLQFWIANDDLMGLDFDNPISQKDSCVLFYGAIEPCCSQETLLEQFPYLGEPDKYFPIPCPFGLSFTAEMEIVSQGDFAFPELFTQLWNAQNPLRHIQSSYDLPDGLFEDDSNEYSGFGHKLLGYPAFTQEDPRDAQGYSDYILLLQSDSIGTKEQDIMWGDSGICNFFIREEDLQNRDFSKVLYNWDCY